MLPTREPAVNAVVTNTIVNWLHLPEVRLEQTCFLFHTTEQPCKYNENTCEGWDNISATNHGADLRGSKGNVCITIRQRVYRKYVAELRRCVKVEVAVLGSRP